MDSWIAERLAAGAAGPTAFALLFAAGVVASLLPCVYPLYPITAAVIRQRPGDGRVNAATYYLGLAAMYAVLGGVAAALGGAFNTLLRLAATQLLLGSLLVVLALATAGWIHLPLFEPRRASVRAGMVGTFVLGASAGFLSSACVGPVVVGVLLKVATATEAVTVGSVVGASLRMLAFGLGVGVPFFAIAMFGLRLPRSGPWMTAIQSGLAAVLLFFAAGYLEKGLILTGLDEATARTAVVAAGVTAVFAFVVQDRQLPRGTRASRSLAGVGLVASASIMFHHLEPSSRPSTSFASASTVDGAGPPVEGPPMKVEGNLKWHLDPGAAYAEAQSRGKNVFIDFFGSWCTNCKAFSELAQTDEDLNEALASAVLLQIDDRSAAFDRYRADPRFPELKVGLPFFVITDPDENLLYKTSDYLATNEMQLFLSD